MVASGAHAQLLDINPRDAILADYAKVQLAKPGLIASAYADLTTSRMTDAAIDTLLEADISACVLQLEHKLGMVNFPDPAQGALTDMGFNLGVPGLLAKFPRLCAAAIAGDWVQCAEECHRRDVPYTRNTWTAMRFVEAGSLVRQNSKA